MLCSPVQACATQRVLLRSNETDKMNQISHRRMLAQTRNADPTGPIRVRQPNRSVCSTHGTRTRQAAGALLKHDIF